MTQTAIDLLKRAGWSPERRVPVDHLVSRLRDAGFDIVAPFRDFMTEFAGLEVSSEDGTRTLEFDIERALVLTDSEWCEAYSEEIDRSVTPVACRGAHMTLLIDESGEFWANFDDLYGHKGKNILQAIELLLVDPPGSHMLDRRLPD